MPTRMRRIRRRVATVGAYVLVVVVAAAGFYTIERNQAEQCRRWREHDLPRAFALLGDRLDASDDDIEAFLADLDVVLDADGEC